MSAWVSQLSPELFWDVDPSDVDADTHLRWLLERVLERGRWEDWILVREHIEKKRIHALLTTLRVDAKSRNFLQIYCAS